MDILTEIIETSDNMVEMLNEEGFFDEHAFIHPSDLRVALQIKMQRKWEQEDTMYLTDDEFLEICNEIISESINEGLDELIKNGYVKMAVNNEGEIVYLTTDKRFNL